jgi:hypothetical protein
VVRSIGIEEPWRKAMNGLQDFLYELTNDHTIGPIGYLATENDLGFVPLDDRGRNHARDMALSLAPMTRLIPFVSGIGFFDALTLPSGPGGPPHRSRKCGGRHCAS